MKTINQSVNQIDSRPEHVRRVHGDHKIGRGLYGARKVWHELRREQARDEYLGLGPVPRCQIERLMRINGLRGARRDKGFVTTRPNRAANRPTEQSATQLQCITTQ